MRTVFLFLACSSFYATAQFWKESKQFELGGTLYSISVYEGGVAYDHYDAPQTPLPDYTFCVVTWSGTDSMPVVVKRITTDHNGEFRATLPAGEYGFVAEADVDSLQPHQFLPHSTEIFSDQNIYSTWWQISGERPVDLREESVTNIVLIYHQVTMCLNCP